MTNIDRSSFTFQDFDLTEDAEGNLCPYFYFGIRTREGRRFKADQLYLDAIDFTMEVTRIGNTYQMFPADNPAGNGRRLRNLRLIANQFPERPFFFGRIVLDLKAGQKLVRKTGDRLDYRVANLSWTAGSSSENTRELFIVTVQELVAAQHGDEAGKTATVELRRLFATADALHHPQKLANAAIWNEVEAVQ